MKTLKFIFTDATYMQTPPLPQETRDAIIQWYQDATADQVFTLENINSDWYMQKRHIARIIAE